MSYKPKIERNIRSGSASSEGGVPLDNSTPSSEGGVPIGNSTSSTSSTQLGQNLPGLGRTSEQPLSTTYIPGLGQSNRITNTQTNASAQRIPGLGQTQTSNAQTTVQPPVNTGFTGPQQPSVNTGFIGQQQPRHADLLNRWRFNRGANRFSEEELEALGQASYYPTRCPPHTPISVGPSASVFNSNIKCNAHRALVSNAQATYKRCIVCNANLCDYEGCSCRNLGMLFFVFRGKFINNIFLYIRFFIVNIILHIKNFFPFISAIFGILLLFSYYLGLDFSPYLDLGFMNFIRSCISYIEDLLNKDLYEKFFEGLKVYILVLMGF